MSTQSVEEIERPCPDPRHGEPPSRIGNRRGKCPTCNRFARRVERTADAGLREEHAERYRELKDQAEQVEYTELLRRARHG